MRKFFLGATLFFSLQAPAQTLFTYGGDSVQVKDFLQAFQKNNQGDKSAKAMKEYLDLYIASRLKIKEAKERGYDTLPQIVADMSNLRMQILPMYEQDAESMKKLVDEAFSRAQKDIHLAHIFISLGANGIADTAAASKKAAEALAQLQKGVAFSEVAKKYSDDPSAKDNGGDLGFITVFSLPYPLENLAYTTAINKYSNLYRSKGGYHIFKNLGERKALGRIKAAQILLAFAPDATPAQKMAQKQLADSIYARLVKGDNFGKLAAQFSNDVVSAQAEGLIPEFGVGQYEQEFENIISSLKDGAISKPFATSHGYHIVKRVSISPINAKKDEKTLQDLKDKVAQSDRAEVTKDILVDKVLTTYQKLGFSEAQLWAYSDSLFDSKKPALKLDINNTTPLFKIGNKTAAVADWVSYAQVFRYKPDGSGIKPYSQVWTDFVRSTALDYYKNNLEDFNIEFRNQINDFKEGNLFFEIMQKEIWGPAQSDTAALQTFYNNHKDQYTWTKSADAIIFYASDAQVAKLLESQVKKTPGKWKELVNNMNDKVTADSARFELAQIPNAGKIALAKGSVTAPVINTADNTASFAYVLNVYTKPAPKSFEEAKGQVINDYQTELENRWVGELKKKYPVAVNQNALTSMLSTAKQ